MSEHAYSVGLVWEGNRGEGTATYAGYGRQYRVEISGKPPLLGSAYPAFRGDPALHNPEDLLLAAAASCHMLSYLALCARRGVNVLAYEDAAEGTLALAPDGGGAFREILLRPRVTLAPDSSRELALALHEEAAALCFIARSCSFPIRHAPELSGGSR